MRRFNHSRDDFRAIKRSMKVVSRVKVVEPNFLKEMEMSGGFVGSPEHEEWLESGGRDEDYNRYYEKWQRRVNKR